MTLTRNVWRLRVGHMLTDTGQHQSCLRNIPDDSKKEQRPLRSLAYTSLTREQRILTGESESIPTRKKSRDPTQCPHFIHEESEALRRDVTCLTVRSKSMSEPKRKAQSPGCHPQRSVHEGPSCFLVTKRCIECSRGSA